LKKKILYLSGILIFVASLASFSLGSTPVKQVHAQTLWFVSWMDSDTGTVNLTFQYLFNWADTQSATVTIYSNWGDGSSNSVVSNGVCCEPPGAYHAAPTISHVYHDTGIYVLTITLSDSTGASASKTVTVTVNSDPQSLPGAVGGESPLHV
jgi:hypothetical protein